jgi:bifunctional enzyme CysN/CysC
VKRIATMDRDLPSAGPGQAVVLELASDIDVSRGAILATPGLEPPVARSLDARLVWLSQEPFSPERGYLLRTATDLVPVTAIDIRAHLDLETLAERTRSTAAANDIALAHIAVGRAIAIDRFADQRQTGSFILVDAISGATVAGGVVAAAQQRQTPRQSTFRLTRDLVARGIGADLPPAGPASESELRRRANEVAILLREAGVAVELDDAWGRAGLDAGAAWRWIMATLSFAFVGAILLGLV